VAATIIANGAGTNAKVVFVDRGTASGVQRGMAVVTPDGIVGKVIAAYPTASQVLLMTDPDFAAGVVTQSGVHGTLKGQGTPQCKIDYVAFEEKVEAGEWVYTSGDDRIFPRGFKVGLVRTVRASQPFKEILIEPSGMQRGLEDVLIVLEGVHERIPDAPSGMQPVYMAPPPPGDEAKPVSSAPPSGAGTEADRLRTQYKAIGEEQKHTFGENPPGTKPVDFTKLGAPNGAQPAPSAVKPAGGPPVVAPAAPPPADAARRVNQSGGTLPGTAPANPNINPPVNPIANPAAAPPKQPATPAVTPSKQPASVPKPGASPGGQLR
jgi:rod shape-determining protein MreC